MTLTRSPWDALARDREWRFALFLRELCANAPLITKLNLRNPVRPSAARTIGKMPGYWPYWRPRSGCGGGGQG